MPLADLGLASRAQAGSFHVPFPQGSLRERQLEAKQALHRGFIRLLEKPHCGLRSSRIVI